MQVCSSNSRIGHAGEGLRPHNKGNYCEVNILQFQINFVFHPSKWYSYLFFLSIYHAVH